MTADLDMTREVVELLQKSVPGAREVRIHAAGHLVQMDNPAEFNRMVLAFLHEVDGRLSTAGALSAQSSCKVEGVWQLVSGSQDGKPNPAGIRELKVITKNHFAFVYQLPGGPKDLRTAADSVAAYRTSGSGGGTYTLQGTSYTEKLEYFSDPSYVGNSLVFTCRMEGDRFIMSGTFPIYQAGKKIGDAKLEEVWRRIE